jgi:SpoVK/Ycf46/Vps4 family AAA+-type ATPase
MKRKSNSVQEDDNDFVIDDSNITTKRKKLKLEDPPPIKNLKDLIDVGCSNKFYKNIDMLVLWDILPHLIELNNMIGMESVKESLFFQIIYYLQGMHTRNIEGDYLHCIITGKAGCGKTSLAKIISKIYQHIGILSKNSKFKLAHREDFVGEYLGQTATKTKKLLNSCLGGVIFVDEIYALSAGRKDRDSFAKEAIDTINAFLSEHKNDFVFIGAGYKDDIDKCFFNMNDGLRRRFAWYHNIEEYNHSELSEILTKMISENNWELGVSKDFLIKIISENEDIFINAGGSCENLFSKIKLVHSQRVFGKSSSLKFKINENDIDEAIKMMKKYNSDNRKPEVKYDYYI